MTGDLESGVYSPELTRISSSVAMIRLRRVDRANAIQPEDVVQILDHFDTIEQEPKMRCLIITGTGDVFSAGFDLKLIANVAGEGGAEFAKMVDRVESSRLFTLAGLNGPAVGGAADLALACDMRIGVHDLHIRVPAARIGLPLYGGALRRFVARLGLSHALSMLLGCQKLSAEALVHAGYLQRIVRRENLFEVISGLAQDIATFPPAPLASMKQALLSLGNELSHQQQTNLAAAIDPLGISERIQALQKNK
jgi:enoyl-CoA hydratase/carnithine racemase